VDVVAAPFGDFCGLLALHVVLAAQRLLVEVLAIGAAGGDGFGIGFDFHGEFLSGKRKPDSLAQ
jgi:hypothetical protein